ncbi:MAG: hypothetical protein IJ551_07390 [Prevotella sp.]|nr:hypothetical protein [Prevotella sp.]
MRKKLFSMLALLCLTAVSAWAQTDVTVNGPTTVDGKPQWTLTMPAGNVVFQVEYEPSVVKVETPTNGTVTVDAGGAKAFTVPDEWNGDNTAVTAADMPSDFTAVAGNAAVAITIPGAASDILIYGISNDKFQIINLKDGVYSSNGVCGKNNVYQYAQQGKKIYYTVASDVTATVAGTAASTIEGVKKDQTVTLNANEGYKFRKVEAKEGTPVPEYADRLSAGYEVTATIIATYWWSQNIFHQVGFTSDWQSGQWYATTITEAQAIALAKYKGSMSLVVYEMGKADTYDYWKFAKADGTTVEIKGEVNINDNPEILQGYKVYYVLPAN